MKAVVIDRPHAIGYRDVDAPRCGPGDVLVRSRTVGVCRTDLDVLHGELDPRWVRYPCIPGHEWSGVVEEVGADAGSVEPGSVALRALERGRLAPGESLGVIGIGTIGSLAILLGRLSSPREIVAYGVRAEELELARALGADHVVDLNAEQPTGDHDLVIESAGALAAFDLATRLPREGGRAVLLGIAGQGRTVEVAPDRLTLRDVELIGSVSYTSAVWSRMVGLLAAGLVDLEPLVTHRFPVAEFEQAFELLERRTGLVAKIVLDHAA
jgi:D-arabinose 1-dehydrogenase-like Zn-dependent alcohol dehydrogenase